MGMNALKQENDAKDGLTSLIERELNGSQVNNQEFAPNISKTQTTRIHTPLEQTKAAYLYAG